MPIQSASDSQKVDYLWKKIVYGAAKTDISGNIDATNEPVASPLLIRGDKILQQASSIAGVIPASNSSVVTVYPTTFPVECISTAAIPTPTLTWQTGQTFWVPPEFGSTYQIKVYIAPSGNAANVLTRGTQVFATGSGNNDLWVFDYQSGVLNFNSNNTPYNASNQPISFTGNSVYISGAVYSGQFGLPASTSVGNITFSNTTISTSFTNANIYFSPTGTGTVQFTGNAAIGLPYGTDATRPTNPEIGFTRYNSARSSIEYWDGSTWLSPGEAVISSQTINPDGSANTFALSSNTSTAGVLVSINGTLQQPTSAYVIVGNNQIQFTEIPLTTDIVEVRYISVGAVTVGSLQFQNTTFVTLDAANVNITGNLLPSANVTYDLGSPSLRWRTGYFSANTINIGGGTIGLHDTLGFTFTTPGGNPQYMMPNGASTSNTFTSSTVTIQGNLAVNGNVTTIGNVSGQYLLGSAQFLTGMPVQYSNVNVAAYTQTQSFTNYSNVNLSAYLGGAVTIGGNLTVNGNLFVNGNVTSINANNLNINDSLIYLADDNPADTLDIGIVSAFTSVVRYQHTGFVRDATDGVWKLFANVVAEPTTTVDFTNATYANLQVGNLIATGAITGGGVKQTTSATPPTNPTVGDQWYDTSTDILFQYTNDGTSQVWVDISSVALNTNVAAITGTVLNISGNGTVAGSFTANSISVNPYSAATAIVNAGSTGVGNIGSLTSAFNTVFAKASSAQYADLAEIYISDDHYAAGTVVIFGGSKEITISKVTHDSAVAGVISSNPAYLMNNNANGLPVALQGRVYCQVQGPINKGELVVTSDISGVAQRLILSQWHPGCILGKSLEIIEDTSIKTIEVVIGRD